MTKQVKRETSRIMARYVDPLIAAIKGEHDAMKIEFATCERSRALEFIQRVYPSKTITDTPDCAGPLLDFVEKDIVRIQDPMMHGNQIAVSPSATNWKEEYREQVVAACKLFA